MSLSDLPSLLGQPAESPAIEQTFVALNTLRRPDLHRDEERPWFDWVLVKHKGIELGFVDRPYFDAQPDYTWCSGPLICYQVYFYAAGFNSRQDIQAFFGDMPHGLTFADSREEARYKLNGYRRRSSAQTDRWDVDGCKLHVRYAPDSGAIESVVVALPLSPLPEAGRVQPEISATKWIELFGEPLGSSILAEAMHPLNILERMKEQDEEREADFTRECGLELYFEDAYALNLPGEKPLRRGLVFGAVKFYRARDREARQWMGELPYGLSFDDSPEELIAKIGKAPVQQSDDRLTGYALWHFENASLHVLYSNFDNQLQRILLMAPGYWREK